MTSLEKEKDPEKLFSAIKNMYQGIEMTSKSFDSIMGKYDVKMYNPLGEIFNPNIHEAMYLVDDPQKKPGTITQVL